MSNQMSILSRSSLRSPTATNKLSKFLSPFSTQISSFSKTLTLKMESQSNSKRPTCPNCSKPIAICLCARLKTPNLDNKVHVTILQHSLEKKHPLNSAKIAKLGLRNVDVFSVSDVLFVAQLVIRQFDLCTQGVCGNAPERFDSGESVEVERSRKRALDQVNEHDSSGGCTQIMDAEEYSGCTVGRIGGTVDFEGDRGALIDERGQLLQPCDEDGLNDEFTSCCDDLTSKEVKGYDVKPLVSVTLEKYGKIRSISLPWKLDNEGKMRNFEELFASPEAVKSLSRGFTVKKLQKRQQKGSLELEQFEEFNIKVPPGTALLFPAEKSVSIEAIDFKVENLIVLDGTWAKANRMYNENPWLRVLPCVKLNVEKLSLFSEVRHQPKPGYLSTIESIVYTLKALEDKEILEGLDSLLNVFESMVQDQRRYKDARLRKLSS